MWIRAVAVTLGCPALGAANPRPFPFTYTTATQARGALEVEQYVDAVPVRVARETTTATDAVTSVRFDLQTELEYGVTDRLEVGAYFVFRQQASPGAPPLTFQGLKQRIRWRLADPGVWPVDVALYGEVGEFHDEFELEEKLLLSRRFGRVLIATNLWVEQEYYWQESDWKLVYNPTLGVSFELSPAVQVGLEGWTRGRFDEDPQDRSLRLPGVTAPADSSLAVAGPHAYLGPTLLTQTEAFWLSMGVYLRLDDWGRTLPEGDDYGRVWVRAILGFEG